MFKEIISKNPTIAKKLLLWFLLVALLPLMLFGYVSYYNASKIMEQEVMNNLISIADNKARQIENYILEKERAIAALANTPTIIDAIEKFSVAFKENGIDSPEYSAIDNKFRSFFTYYKEQLRNYDLFLISSEGDIIFTVVKEDDLGTNLKTGSYKESELAKIFYETLTLLEITVSDFKYYAPSNGPATFIAAPVLKEGNAIGTVAFQIENEEAYELMQDYVGLGTTGEILIGSKLGNDAVFVNPLRHDPQAAFRRKVPLGSKEALPIQEAVQGRKGSGLSIDYRGKEILAVWRYLPSPRWGMVVKIDTKEAFLPVIKIRNLLMIIGIITIFAVMLLALMVSKSISDPIIKLHEGTEIIGGGNMDYRVGTDINDEIGQLSRAFDKMTESLKSTTISRDELTKEITERRRAEEALQKAHENLEQRVKARTAELARANEQLNREIEEHQQTGGRLRTERDRFKNILEVNPNGIYIVDQQYNIEYINPVVENEFGPVDGQKCYAYFHDRTESCPWCKNDEVFAGKSVWWKWYSKKNNRYYDLFDTPIKNSGGSISKFEIFYDITERTQAEERLKESEQKTSGILHSITDRMSTIDRDNTIIWANEVTKELFGADIVGKKCFSYYHGKKQPCDSCNVMKTFKDGQDHHHESQVVDRYGNNRIFNCISSVANCDENGKPKLVLDVARDITQIKKSEDELHQLRAELLHATRAGTMVELTGALAHELNHPLGSILNNANAAKRFLKSNNPDLDEIRDIIADIISEDRRASEIIQKLRALMRKTAVKFVPLEINDIMEEVVSLTKSEIVIKKVSLSKQLATKLPKINGERIQLQQIFLNLVINAIDAIKGCKVKNIHISTAKYDAESIIVCVRDSGKGFDEKNKGSLFKPFFTTKKEGLGMGLSVNKTIVNSHGGDIWVENNKEGGASFFITFPVYKEQSS